MFLGLSEHGPARRQRNLIMGYELGPEVVKELKLRIIATAQSRFKKTKHGRIQTIEYKYQKE